jgi:ketosteroid isomerase-like protein
MSAAANRETIGRFYGAFQQRDGATMAACYRADATFRDPVFDLSGARVGAMWKMLCSRGVDLRVEFANVAADDSGGSADWQAWYVFSATGRQVHNIIQARFRLVDGMIVEHVDEFDFWRWSRQAMGPLGLLLGWTPWVRRKVRAQAAHALDRFIATKAAA